MERSYSERRFWCSYILFIFIIGGILLLFIYITRLAPNQIFSPSNKTHQEVGWAKDLSALRYSQSLIWSAVVSSSRSHNPRTSARVRHKISLCCTLVWFPEYRNLATFFTRPLPRAERFLFFPWPKQYLSGHKFKVHREVETTVTWRLSHSARNDIQREHKVWPTVR
jgi:hypothetical protein